jgi:hypothetical protein
MVMDFIDPAFDLIYALIIVCNHGVAQCDVDHAIWVEQSKPEFSTMDSCFDSAEMHIIDEWSKLPVSGELSDHTIQLFCTETSTAV